MTARLTLLLLTLLAMACDGDKRAAVAQGGGAAAPVTSKAAPTPTADTQPRLAAVAGCTLDTALEPGVPGSPGHFIPSKINPNGHSELAFLMRTMQAELGRVREAVAAGKKVEMSFDQHRIRCAWPTSKSDRNQAFDTMAIAYLHAVDEYNSSGDAKGFNAVVQRCLDCHSQTCEGPMEAIRPLKIPE